MLSMDLATRRVFKITDKCLFVVRDRLAILSLLFFSTEEGLVNVTCYATFTA